MRILVAVSLSMLGVAGLRAQVNGLQCNAAAAQTPIARAEGTAEPVSDVILTCSGGTPTPLGQAIPLSNVSIFLNTNITSRIIGAGGLSEATLMIDEPFADGSGGNNAVPDASVFTPPAGSPPQILCGGAAYPANGQGNSCPESGTANVEGAAASPYFTQANVFSGVQTSANSVVWTGVPIDPPGAGANRIIRITNVRANVSQLGLSSTSAATQVQMFVAISGPQAITLANPMQTVATVALGLTITNGAAATFSQCQSHNASLLSTAAASAGAVGFDLTVAVAETFSSALNRRNVALTTDGVTVPAPQAQNVPEYVFSPDTGLYGYNSESGFYAPALFAATPIVGLADQGARIRIQFNNVGAGVHIFVPAIVTLNTTKGTTSNPPQPQSPVAAGIPTAELVLVQTDANGNSAPGFQAVAPVSMIQGTSVAEVSYSGTTGYAVYEVVNADHVVYELTSIPVAVAFVSDPGQNQPGAGQTTTNTNLAPVSAVSTADAAAPIPRFVDVSTPQNAFTVASCATAPLLQVAPIALTFNAVFEGDAPPAQFVNLAPVGNDPVSFQVVLDGGAPGTPAPAWITVQSTSANAPARIAVIVNQGTMAPQTTDARVVVTDSGGNQYPVQVTLNINNVPAQLQVSPDTLRFAARAVAPGTLVGTLGIRNAGGGGAVRFSTLIQGNSSWISRIDPSTGETTPNSTVFVNVIVNTQGLATGSYRDVIVFSSIGNIVNVPVTLFVAGNGSILALNTAGIRFQARQDGGYTTPQSIQVLNVGDQASNLAWMAEFVTGSDLFSASATSGNASLANPGIINVTPTANALQMNPGSYYGLLKISSNQALNSPQFVVLVLDLASSTSQPLPDPSPAGLIFIGPAGQPIADGQVVNINTSSSAEVPFQGVPSTVDGGGWLAVAPAGGVSTGQSAGQITVTADPTSLAPGIYSGEVDIAMSGTVRGVNVTLIVQEAISSGTVAAAASCVPTALQLTEVGQVNGFAVPTSFPAALTAQLNDNCGNLVSGASVTASFSNNDSPLPLLEGQTGIYNATWQTGGVDPQVVITFDAEAAGLREATAKLTGSVTANQNPAPAISENGTVNVFNRVPAGPLASGMIIEVYGKGLAATSGHPGVLPLTTEYQGTVLAIGPYQSPLYYVSSGQLDVQVPVELADNPAQQYPVYAMLNGAISVPVSVDLVPVQLGVAAGSDRHVNAQHGVGSAHISESSPAKPNEVIVIYVSGMGPTNPPVASGHPAPSQPLAKVTIPPTVTLDGEQADIKFAGLTPGLVGLYQINFQVPGDAKTGDLNLVVRQNGVSSNTTLLPVKR